MGEEIVEVKVNSITENYKDLQALIECLNVDMDKFQNKKVKVAGQRARNNLLNCKKLCDTLRKQIITEISEIPVKHRIKDVEVKEEKVDPIEPPSRPPTPEPIETGANGPDESHQEKPEKKPKRTRKANKKKIKKDT